jgi:multidrug efflux pump subunit AcrB
VNGAIAWFVRRRVAANLLMLVLVVGGLVIAPSIPQKIFPDIEFGIVTIDVPYLGAAPEEIEQSVCIPIEESIASVVGVENIYSIAAEDRCRVWTELYPDADADSVATGIRNKVDQLQNLPKESDEPIVAKLDYRRSVMDLAISGTLPEGELKALGRRVRDELTGLDGITQADLIYARPYEISIEVPEETLRRYGLSFDQVVSAVRRSSLDLPGGRLKTSGGEILLRSTGQAYSGTEFEDIVVLSRSDGTRVVLGDIARIVDGFEDVELSASFDEKPAVMVRVYRVGEENVISLSNQVNAWVALSGQWLPAGAEITVWQDQSTILRGRIDTLMRNGRSGLLLVFAVLALFLRFRLALWVSLGVPIALLGAIMVMPVFGASIDEITLFAFILVLGILVDDAIVVGENIYTYEEKVKDRVRAAIEGTQQVAVPVIFGVLTTVAAFSPLLFIPGHMGQLFSFMGIMVIACLMFSLVESQLVLPSHLSHGSSQIDDLRPPRFGFQRRYRAVQERFSSWLVATASRRYRPALQSAMHWRYLTVAIALGLLMLTIGVLGSGRVRFNFFPPVEADYVAAQMLMPQGAPVSDTRAGLDQIVASSDELIRQIDAEFAKPGESLVKHRLVSLGREAFRAQNQRGSHEGSHVGEVVLELVPSEQRRVSTGAISKRWSDLVGVIPGAKELTFASDFLSAGSPVDLQLRGPADVSLPDAARFLRERLAEYPGVFDIADSFQAGKREVKLDILPDAEPLGLSMQDLASQVRQAFYGEEAQRIQRGRDEVRVMVRYPEDERRSLADLDHLRIRTADGAEVPFWSVARASHGRGFSDIQRTNRERVVNVTADVDRSQITPNEVMADLDTNVFPQLRQRFPGITVGTEGEMADQTKALGGLMSAYPIALLVIFTLLAIPLNSYIQPLIIMSVIPFGIVGAVAGHLFAGLSVSFPSIMGIVALSGVVVNASLVLVVKVNRLRDEGRTLREAVVEGAASRFRPIVLTAVTTFAGLTPLMLEGSLQAQSLIPMAISLAFGVLFATVITLVLVPCSYIILEDIARLWKRPHRLRPRAVPIESKTQAA